MIKNCTGKLRNGLEAGHATHYGKNTARTMRRRSVVKKTTNRKCKIKQRKYSYLQSYKR